MPSKQETRRCDLAEGSLVPLKVCLILEIRLEAEGTGGRNLPATTQTPGRVPEAKVNEARGVRSGVLPPGADYARVPSLTVARQRNIVKLYFEKKNALIFKQEMCKHFGTWENWKYPKH